MYGNVREEPMNSAGIEAACQIHIQPQRQCKQYSDNERFPHRPMIR